MVAKELGRMWKRRLHIRESNKIGPDLAAWNEKFLLDIERLTQDVKQKGSIPLTAQDEDESIAYARQDVDGFVRRLWSMSHLDE